jgi:hypothetical protein
LRHDDSYQTAKKAAISAADSDLSRCDDMLQDDDDYQSIEGPDIYYVDDYYYYNGFGTTDDKGDAQKISIFRRHNTHRTIHKIPIYVYAIFVIFVSVIITSFILYCRWKRSRARSLQNSNIAGLVRFTQIPTDDDDFEYETHTFDDSDNPFINDKPNTKISERYQSL